MFKYYTDNVKKISKIIKVGRDKSFKVENILEQGCQTESQEGQVSAGFCGFLSISCQLRPADQGVSIL